MTLTLATEGCCKGHPCDNCKTCQAGRCCRRDNPNYKLPELGDWDGPIYGRLGVLETDGDKCECHICGAWFHGLNRHAWNTHNLLAREYKALFGLNLTSALMSPQASQRWSAIHGPRLAIIRPLVMPSLTPEQLSLRLSGRKQAPQMKLNPEYTSIRKQSAKKAHETIKTRMSKNDGHIWWTPKERKHPEKVELVCVFCGRSRYVEPCVANRYKTCGAAECQHLAHVQSGRASAEARQGAKEGHYEGDL